MIQEKRKYSHSCRCRCLLDGLGLRGISHQLHIILKLKSSLRVTLAFNKVHNQGVLNSEHRVVGQILVLAVEDLGSQRAVTVPGSLGIESVLAPF